MTQAFILNAPTSTKAHSNAQVHTHSTLSRTSGLILLPRQPYITKYKQVTLTGEVAVTVSKKTWTQSSSRLPGCSFNTVLCCLKYSHCKYYSEYILNLFRYTKSNCQQGSNTIKAVPWPVLGRKPPVDKCWWKDVASLETERSFEVNCNNAPGLCTLIDGLIDRK